MNPRSPKSLNIAKIQIFDQGNFLPLRGRRQIGTSNVRGFIWYFFIDGEKNDVSGYVIFSATLLDFTVK